MTIGAALLILFITLKLIGVIAWAWIWVLAPLWIELALWIVIGIPVFIFVSAKTRNRR